MLMAPPANAGSAVPGSHGRQTGAPAGYTYVVNSSGDARDTNLDDGACDGTCTLRGALEQANHNCAASPATVTTIDFAIPGKGVRTIRPVNNPNAGNQTHGVPLGGIVCPVVIDGTTQGGAGYTGTPLIQLDGENAPAAGQQGAGLGFGGNAIGSTVKGLVINRWLGPGLSLSGPGGGTASGFVIQGNYIGTDTTGRRASPNSTYDGIVVAGNATVTIGGTGQGDGNVISGNAGRGIDFGAGSVGGSTVQGNFIGTDASGTSAVPNQGDGIFVNGNSGTVIGGADPGAGNVISANKGDGIGIGGTTVGSFVIQGNWIGTKPDGSSALGNAGFGVAFQNKPGGDLLGGTAPGAANTIAFNGRAGVQVGVGTGHQISENSIFNNAGMGIDLTICSNGSCPGPDPNDPGDGDTGANQFQNFPVISASKTSGGITTITGTLNSAASSPFTIELFSSPTCDATGYGEGKHFLGATAVTTDGSGNAKFRLSANPAVPSGWSVTGTATDGSGNTSEFSPCRGPLTVTPNRGTAGATLVVSGKHLGASETVTLIWNCPIPSCTTHTITVGTVQADASGSFQRAQVTIPASAAPGDYWLGARTSALFATARVTVSS
jgi:hypothetical protein